MTTSGHLWGAVRASSLVVCGLLAAGGAVVAPAAALGIGALLAVLAGVVVTVLRGVPELPPLPHPAVAGTRAACLPAAIAGAAALGQGAGIVAVTLAAVTATAVVAHWSTRPPAAPPHPAPGGDTPGQDDSLRQLLRHLPTDVLLDEWRSTQPGSGPPDDGPAARGRLRGLLIDEMRRRDPAGTRRWLADGAGGPPDGCVGGRPD